MNFVRLYDKANRKCKGVESIKKAVPGGTAFRFGSKLNLEG
jgi:hypothetical protein